MLCHRLGQIVIIDLKINRSLELRVFLKLNVGIIFLHTIKATEQKLYNYIKYYNCHVFQNSIYITIQLQYTLPMLYITYVYLNTYINHQITNT